MKSSVTRERVLQYVNLKDLIKEEVKTEELGTYKQDVRDKKKVVHVNHATNFILRHYSDSLVISIFTDAAAKEAQYSTKFELNNIELNEDKMTVMVVGTGGMNKKQHDLYYYMFELDLAFKVKLASDDAPNELDIAIQNYKLMKEQILGRSNNVVVTEAERSIIVKLLERTKKFSGMDEAKKARKIKLRRCLFTIRNMLRCSYRQLMTRPNGSVLNLRVNPKSFMMGVGYGVKSTSANKAALQMHNALEEQAVVKELKAELMRGSPPTVKQQSLSLSDGKYRFADQELARGSPAERHNILSLELL